MSRPQRANGKLIRDRVPEVFGWQGVSTLPGGEYAAALRAKLGEEVAEYLDAASPRDRRSELADVLEVLLALAAHDGLTPADLETARAEKLALRGGFTERLWWQP